MKAKSIMCFLTVLAFSVFANCQNSIKLIVGTDASFPPMEAKNSSGELEGFDIDIFKNIASAKNIEFTFKNIGWAEIFSELDNKSIDLIISGVSILEWRKAKYDLSIPYYKMPQYIVVRSDSKYRTYDDLKNATFGVMKGSETERSISILGLKYISYNDYEIAFNQMYKKKVDAVIADSVTARIWIADTSYQGKIRYIKDNPFYEQYAIVVRKGNDKILKLMNDGITNVKNSKEYLSYCEKWFSK
jgi:ABC-type amino acid transport substrate-binding protein